jgi:predicted nucleic acid-binding protein
MKPRLYLETTIISYYANRFSSNLIVAGRQQITRDWWDEKGSRFELFVSPLVLNEAGAGELNSANRRMDAIKDIPVLAIDGDCEEVAALLIANGQVPPQYPEDALHIAIAAVHSMDFLLTWNFSHINNAFTKHTIYKAIEKYGLSCPQICSPEELEEI